MNWMKEWNKISYFVQILAACFVFIRFAGKKEHFSIRCAAGSFLTLLFSYLLGSLLPLYENGFLFAGYSIIMIGVTYGFLRFTTTMSRWNAAYTVLVVIALQHIAYDLFLIERFSGLQSLIIDVAIYALVYGIAYLTYAETVIKDELENAASLFSARGSFLVPVVTMFIVIWLFSMLENSGIDTFAAKVPMRILYRLIDAAICIFILWVQHYQQEQLRLTRELDGLGQAMAMQAEQYKLKQEMVDSINLKCHDLKHQIRQIKKMQGADVQEYLTDLEKDVLIYDSAMRVGNRALDIILMDKALYCENHDIQWTCMIDGEKLEFMKDSDINSIFGNALDNAVTAVMKVQNPQMRVITLNMIQQKNLLVIQIRNYFEGLLEFTDGIPKTTKTDKQSHGFGMKSIRYTVEKYKGVMTAAAQDGVFTLQVLIPVPEK